MNILPKEKIQNMKLPDIWYWYNFVQCMFCYLFFIHKFFKRKGEHSSYCAVWLAHKLFSLIFQPLNFMGIVPKCSFRNTSEGNFADKIHLLYFGLSYLERGKRDISLWWITKAILPLLLLATQGMPISQLGMGTGTVQENENISSFWRWIKAPLFSQKYIFVMFEINVHCI